MEGDKARAKLLSDDDIVTRGLTVECLIARVGRCITHKKTPKTFEVAVKVKELGDIPAELFRLYRLISNCT
jgi:hypothetical protein